MRDGSMKLSHVCIFNTMPSITRFDIFLIFAIILKFLTVLVITACLAGIIVLHLFSKCIFSRASYFCQC